MTMTMMMLTYSGDKFKRLSFVVPRALDQSAVVQEEGIVGSNLRNKQLYLGTVHWALGSATDWSLGENLSLNKN